MTNIKDFLAKCAWGFVPAIIIGISYWFAGFMTADMASLSYSVDKRTVNGLSSFYMQVHNNEDDIAIDEVTISSIPNNSILSAISEGPANTKVTSWSGTINSGGSVELLVITDKPLPTDKKAIEDILEARYQIRDSESGKLIWKKIEISEQGIITWNKGVAYVFWWAVPLLSLFLLALVVFKFMPSPNSNPPQPQA